MIYKEGYYLQWDEDTALDVSQHLSILKIEFTDEQIIDSVEYCISLDLFSKDMYVNYQILTSVSIQENYQYACEQNKRKDGVTEFSLLPPRNSKGKDLLGAKREKTSDESEKITINAEETPINAEETSVSSNNTNTDTNIDNDNNSSSISSEEQQRLQDFNLLIQFFKMNYKSPLKELQKCREWYEAQDVHWGEKSQAWRMYRVKKWNQDPPAPPRFEQKFVDGWLKVIDALKKNNVQLDILFDALSIDIWYSIDSQNVMLIHCSERLRNEIDKEQVMKVLRQLVISLGACNLKYVTPKLTDNQN